jgi:hypothetical protein
MLRGNAVLTIEMWLDSVGRKEPRQCPIWPPDVYGITGALLKRSGAYLRIFEDHSPDGYLKGIEELGVSWRKRIDAQKHPTFDSLARARPTELKASWAELMRARSLPINEIQGSQALTEHLIRMTLIADEASAGIGVDWDNVTEDGPVPSPFLSLADRIKSTQDLRSFGWEVSPDVVCVLGKQHTPQVGATFRSLSHHLSLYLPSDIEARWHGPYRPWQESSDSSNMVNLLLLPWPNEIETADFSEVPTRAHRTDPDDEMPGYFSFRPTSTLTPQGFGRALRRALANAREHTNQIDAVVFPEVALTHEQYDVAERIAVEQRIISICGVRSIARGRRRDLNLSVIQPAGAMREGGSTGRAKRRLVDDMRLVQAKHHRWCLNRDQLVCYQLGGQLSITRNWWENIELPERLLYFFSLNRLTWSVLICEDLARQDPAADLIRAVGPNLLIALLMDGPQLKDRWAARYASVLAEDPGSSVLTLTSLGMARRSRPFLRATGRRPDPSRVIALWRDAVDGEAEICLDADENACVLSLECRRRKEYSADGRHDGTQSRYPVFAGFKSFRSEL